MAFGPRAVLSPIDVWSLQVIIMIVVRTTINTRIDATMNEIGEMARAAWWVVCITIATVRMISEE